MSYTRTWLEVLKQPWYVRGTFPCGFPEGKLVCYLNPGEFTEDSQRPITCLNTLNKRYTSCLLVDASYHVLSFGFMQGDQRGAKQGFSGTVDNLLIDRMVCQDALRHTIRWIIDG